MCLGEDVVVVVVVVVVDVVVAVVVVVVHNVVVVVAGLASLVHRALHADHKPQGVKLTDNRWLRIVVAQNGSRKVVVRGWTFMQQNVNKASDYAKRAKEGQKLTWVMPAINRTDEPWGLLCEDRIEKPCKIIGRDNSKAKVGAFESTVPLPQPEVVVPDGPATGPGGFLTDEAGAGPGDPPSPQSEDARAAAEGTPAAPAQAPAVPVPWAGTSASPSASPAARPQSLWGSSAGAEAMDVDLDPFAPMAASAATEAVVGGSASVKALSSPPSFGVPCKPSLWSASAGTGGLDMASTAAAAGSARPAAPGAVATVPSSPSGTSVVAPPASVGPPAMAGFVSCADVDAVAAEAVEVSSEGTQSWEGGSDAADPVPADGEEAAPVVVLEDEEEAEEESSEDEWERAEGVVPVAAGLQQSDKECAEVVESSGEEDEQEVGSREERRRGEGPKAKAKEEEEDEEEEWEAVEGRSTPGERSSQEVHSVQDVDVSQNNGPDSAECVSSDGDDRAARASDSDEWEAVGSDGPAAVPGPALEAAGGAEPADAGEMSVSEASSEASDVEVVKDAAPRVVLEEPAPDLAIVHSAPATRPLTQPEHRVPAAAALPPLPANRRSALFTEEEIQGIAAQDDEYWRMLQTEARRLQRQVGEDGTEADQLAFMISDIKLMLDLFGIPYITSPSEADAQVFFLWLVLGGKRLGVPRTQSLFLFFFASLVLALRN